MFTLNDGRSYETYKDSVHEDVFMACDNSNDYIVARPGLGFCGEKVSADNGEWLLCGLNHENAQVLRRLFPFTAPSKVLGRDKTFGVGDRLGLAGDGHLAVFKKYPQITPVLSQQSIRELSLTGRTYSDVLDSSTFAVFRNNYTSEWGADGDHVKKPEEIDYALSCGYTMITLDCGERIDNSIDALSDDEVKAKYTPNAELESTYLNKTFDVGEGFSITFDENLFKRTVLIYSKAIDFAVEMFNEKIKSADGTKADFEISIDETMTPTLPAQHFFVANELTRRNVIFATIAPRFCGEFQKGIDYIGDVGQFAREMKEHAAISRHFGYKISIHSGSDKFSIFPSAGRETRGRYHLKTSGTNWLEAMILVAMKDPALYREIHKFALTVFSDAKRNYHVTTNLDNVPDVDTVEDENLPSLFENNDSRQLIHITYGHILQREDFHKKLYTLWRTYRNDYSELLAGHIGRHAEAISLQEP